MRINTRVSTRVKPQIRSTTLRGATSLPAVRKSASRRLGSSFGNRVKTKLKSSGSKLFETATKSLKETALRRAEDTAIDGIEKITQEIAERIKAPVGANGRNLNLVKMELLDQPAVGGTTESTSMFSYRPKRTQQTSDTIRYKAIRNRKTTIANTDGQQQPGDFNLALLEPPLNDILTSSSSYTNFSIRNEFDKMLKARVTANSVQLDTLKQSLVANYHSLSSVMILRAPEQGAIVEIYDLQPKFGIGPGTYQSETYALDHLSPYWCWLAGLDDATIDTMDLYNALVPGGDPLASPTFRRTWSIIKKTTVRMTSNSIHRHRFVFNINKSVTYDEMAQASTQGGTAPWLPSQMVVVRGYPTATSQAEVASVVVQQESTLSYSSRLAKTTDIIVYNNDT